MTSAPGVVVDETELSITQQQASILLSTKEVVSNNIDFIRETIINSLHVNVVGTGGV